MSSHIQTAGVAIEEVELLGNKYTLQTPPIMEVFAGLENAVLRDRGDVLALAVEACEKAPQSMHAAIWDAALRQKSRDCKPSTADIEAFINTPRGMAFMLWTCLKAHHANEFPTEESVLVIVTNLAESKLTEVMAKTQIVTGEAEAKN